MNKVAQHTALLERRHQLLTTLTPKPPLLILPDASAAMLPTPLLSSALDGCLLSWPGALAALLFWRVAGLDTAAGGGMLVTSSTCSP